MRVVITGHRIQKLEQYDLGYIQFAIDDVISELKKECGISIAYSGMASGVDLWFCQSCDWNDVPYIACVPFEEQSETMSTEDATLRKKLISEAKEVKSVRNSWMVENCDIGIVVWDGNKGGTHNVLQQLVEKKKNFYWINPVLRKTWKCFA